jgi:NAD(P)H-hydrate epimerase
MAAAFHQAAADKGGLTYAEMMENAGRAVAEAILHRVKITEETRILILCGSGNNGGDGLVAARFLHNWGARVTVVMADHPDNFSQLTKWHSGVLRSMFVSTLYPTNNLQFRDTINGSDLIIDALIGYNLQGNPQGMYAALVNMANASGKKIIAVDVPTGLDSNTGQPYEPCIKARYTLTFALPKKGLLEKHAGSYTGELWIGDIGIPHEAYELMGLHVENIFEKKDLVKV